MNRFLKQLWIQSFKRAEAVQIYRPWLLLSVLLVLFFVGQNIPSLRLANYINLESPETIAIDGVWSWFGDPRAIRYKANTYIGAVSKTGSVSVYKYNHRTKSITSFVLRSNFQIDDHANPSIIIRPDGRIVVFYSKHSGSAMYYRISTLPEDITNWDNELTVATNSAGTFGYTYPNPIQLSKEDNKLYMFWRGGNRNPTYSTTMDLVTWTPAQELITAPGKRPYVKYASDNNTSIDFAYTDGHPDEVAVNNIYYAHYENGAFYKADGTLITTVGQLPFSLEKGDLVYDSTKSSIKSWVWDIAIDASGKPTIVYSVFPTKRDHRYRYARWTGTTWLDTEITVAGDDIEESQTEPYYSGGITLDHENPAIVYLSRGTGGSYEIERWVTSDNGITWLTSTVTSNSGTKNVRPIVPRNHVSGEMDVIWMSGKYTHFTNYDMHLRSTFF